MKERVFRYRDVERGLLAARPGARVLDLGCGAGENLARLARYGARPVGLDPSRARAREAARTAPAVCGAGEALPWRDQSFELVYVSHVLHHAADLGASLREARRVLAPGGLLFVIETVEDSPLLRLARRVRPSWEGDPVTQRFRSGELRAALEGAGFRVLGGETFNWSYFAWELLPLRVPALDRLSPLFIALESGLFRLLGRYGAHCWLAAQRPGPALFPAPARGAARGAA